MSDEECEALILEIKRKRRYNKILKELIEARKKRRSGGKNIMYPNFTTVVFKLPKNRATHGVMSVSLNFNKK